MSGANMFLVNNSSQPSQLQVTDIGELKEKGGILYGHIGQEKKVFVYNLFIRETIEERLNEILKEKSDIYEQITESFAEKILS